MIGVKAIGEVPSVQEERCPIKEFNTNAIKDGAEYWYLYDTTKKHKQDSTATWRLKVLNHNNSYLAGIFLRGGGANVSPLQRQAALEDHWGLVLSALG